jgi:outer membrane protein assembly factor BamB
VAAGALGALIPHGGLVTGTAFVTATPTGSPRGAASPLFRGNPARTGEQPGPGPSATPTLHWQFAMDGPVSSSPAVVDGVAYVGSKDGLVAVEAATGEQRWLAPVGDTSNSSPAVVDGIVYAGAGGHLHALDARTGEERWRVPAGDGIGYASPVVIAGVVYAGAGRSGAGAQGDLAALEAASGRERWRRPGVGGSPAAVNGVLYVNAGIAVVAVEAATGAERWRIEPGGYLGETPAVGDDVVYISGWYPSFIAAVETATGAERWRLELSEWIRTSPALAAATVYHHGNDDVGAPVHLYALDAASGVVNWRVPSGRVADAASPAVADGVVYAGGGEHLHALDAASGRERWRFPLAVTSAPVVVGGVVYVGGRDGLSAIGDA